MFSGKRISGTKETNQQITALFKKNNIKYSGRRSITANQTGSCYLECYVLRAECGSALLLVSEDKQRLPQVLGAVRVPGIAAVVS